MSTSTDKTANTDPGTTMKAYNTIDILGLEEGRELDRRVAELLGDVCDETGEWHNPTIGGVMFAPDGGPWTYSTNLSAAWRIVTMSLLPPPGLGQTAPLPYRFNQLSIEWCAVFLSAVGTTSFAARAKTPALAICRAFVAAMEHLQKQTSTIERLGRSRLFQTPSEKTSEVTE
jgi:hypothetical protein